MVTDNIPTGVDCFIAGDRNGHSSLWDPVQPTDSRGTRIEEWMKNANLVCLNSGAATRHNRSTGDPSSPDIILAPTTWTNRLRWQTVEDIGGSDHLPILIQAFCRTQRLAPPARRQRWKPNHDLSEFRATLEHKLEDAKLQVDTLERVKQFTALVIETATATVPEPNQERRRDATSHQKSSNSSARGTACDATSIKTRTSGLKPAVMSEKKSRLPARTSGPNSSRKSNTELTQGNCGVSSTPLVTRPPKASRTKH